MDVDWQNNYHQVKDRGMHLLLTEKWCDCRFLVGTAPNQRLISGHKIFLAMASPVFERMFYGNLPDESDPIVIPDVQPDAFQAMLEYIYSDLISISSFDKACELCYVAKKYMLPHVVEQCTSFLWSDLSPKNACRAYEFAKLFDEPRLMQRSMEIISANTREVLNDPSFTDIEPLTLLEILDQEKLNIDSELDLFNGLIKYAMERSMFTDDDSATKQQSNSGQHSRSGSQVRTDAMPEQASGSSVEEIKMEPDVAEIIRSHEDAEGAFDEDNSPEVGDDVVVVDSDTSGGPAEPLSSSVCSLNGSIDSQRHLIDESILRQAVKKIRFLTLTPQQFAEGPARSKLLQQHEALAILIKISSPFRNDYPMPEGFCNSRTFRHYHETRQRDSSLYRNSVGSINSSTACFAPPENMTHSYHMGMANANANASGNVNADSNQSTPAQVINAHYSNASGVGAAGAGDGDAVTNDTRRCYCIRTLNQQFDYRNTSVTDCGLTFQVDTNICITGVQVPTQVLCGELMNSAGFTDRYTEILYAHIQDMQGSRLTYTHCTSRVRYDSLLEISFDRPIYIYRNQIYKVYVVFNKVGWYPMYTCVPDIICNRVKFMFNVGNPIESVRDGLIRAIIFCMPTEQIDM